MYFYNVLIVLFIFPTIHSSESPSSSLEAFIKLSPFVAKLKEQCSVLADPERKKRGTGCTHEFPNPSKSPEDANMYKYITGGVIKQTMFGKLTTPNLSVAVSNAESSSGPETAGKWIMEYAVKKRKEKLLNNELKNILKQKKKELTPYGKESPLSRLEKEKFCDELDDVCRDITYEVNAERLRFTDHITRWIDDVHFVKVENLSGELMARRCCFRANGCDSKSWSDYGCFYIAKYKPKLYLLLTVEKLNNNKGPSLLLDYIFMPESGSKNLTMEKEQTSLFPKVVLSFLSWLLAVVALCSGKKKIGQNDKNLSKLQ